MNILTHAPICGATIDVLDGPYGEPIPWQRCGLPANHDGTCVEAEDEAEDGTPGYGLGFERGLLNAPRCEAEEYGGGDFSDEWLRGYDAGFEQREQQGSRAGFRDV
jgi:hypothetical protein